MKEIIVDSFAGGGGASTGIELAGWSVDEAINHDPAALAMHLANHPSARHWQTPITALDPLDVTQGRPVALFWASPDCKHFSKAKGGVPVQKRIRDLAWVVVHWAERVKPRVIILENVEEFTTWGPLGADSRPDKERAGETFSLWLKRLKRAGYRVEHRELRACDYGAPTIRKRFFLIARRDGEPIRWPAPTHGPGLLPYRTAAEIIDWSLPCKSIFGRSKPLAEATLRRIARGLRRYVLECPDPYLVPLSHSGDCRIADLGQPLRTLTASREIAFVAPHLVVNTTGHAGRPMTEPASTITTGGQQILSAPYLVPQHGEAAGQLPRCSSVNELLPVVTPGNQQGQLVAAFMAQHNLGATGHEMREPVSTICQAGSQQQLVTSHLAVLRNNQDGRGLDEPLPTLTTGGHIAEIRAFLTTYYGSDQDTQLGEPLPTITTRDRFGLVTCWELRDIGMRMLSPRELFRAQGFPESYILEPLYRGKPLTKTAQIRCCGNSVCPPVAAALVAANLGARQMEVSA